MQVIEAYETVRHALHGRDPSSPLSLIDIVNEAGAHLVNMHPWRWLERYTSSLAYVAGQNYVTLPTDFEGLIGDPQTPRVYGITMTDQATVDRVRQQATTGRPYVACLSSLPFDGLSVASRLVLSIAPTPADNESNVLSCFYRAGWVAATADTRFLDVRPHMKPLYKAVLRAYAMGVEEDNLTAQLDSVRLSSVFIDACGADGRAQSVVGMSSGGAIQMARESRRPYDGVWPAAGSIVGP